MTFTEKAGSGRFRARDVHRLFESRIAYDRLSIEQLAGVLEAKNAELGWVVSAPDIVRAVHAGQGLLSATRSAIAYTVDHGAHFGIELRYLYVAHGLRRRGAGRALLVKLRAQYAHRRMFFWCRNARHADAARMVGFAVEAAGDDWWQMSTGPVPAAVDRAMRTRRLPPPCPPPRAPLAIETSAAPGGGFFRTVCATAILVAASASCMDA